MVMATAILVVTTGQRVLHITSFPRVVQSELPLTAELALTLF